MDTYFKAAVCDLDKLLDEFELNTDECDLSRAPQNPCDSKHHSLPLDLGFLQRVYPTQKLQENANSCTVSEEISQASHTRPNEGIPNCSSQNERSVSGPDILTIVNSASSEGSQGSNLGSSIPMCDLVSDISNLIRSAGTNVNTQKLQPGDSYCSEDCLSGFGKSCMPLSGCVFSLGCRGVLCTEQNDGDSMLQHSGPLKTEESNQLALKSDVFGKAEVSDLCDYHFTLKIQSCIEVFDHLEQTAHPNTTCVSETLQNSNVYDPKDETACEKLPSEPQDGSTCSPVSEEIHGGNTAECVTLEDQCKMESMPSGLPHRHQLDKNHGTLPESHALQGSTCQTGAEVELEEQITEENVDSEKVAEEVLNSALPLCESVEVVQTSLPDLPPLPVSPYGSSVVTEEKVNSLPQNEIAEVISDTLTTDLSDCESCKETDFHEQEGYLSKINQIIVEKRDEETCNTKNVIDDSDSDQVKAIDSTFMEYEGEPYGVDIDCYYDESISQTVADFTAVESIIESNTLVSDAELDEFLYGQSHLSSSLNSLSNSYNLMAADTEVNLRNENLDFTQVTEEHALTKLEDISSISSNLEVSLAAHKLKPPPEESAFHIQNVTEHDSEAQVSKLPTEGARPKLLCDSTQGDVGQRQLNQTHVLEKAVTPEAPFSRNSITSDENSEPAGESGTEAGKSQTFQSVESLKTPAALLQKQPMWVPDSEAPNCMDCQVKFTFTRRRHHCRACGKVFCGGCCKRKCKLQYMEKEARVCTRCYDNINKAQAFERMMSPTGPVPNSSVSSENASAPPLQEACITGNDSCPLFSSPLPISALKQSDNEELCPKEQKRVWFADGILPTGEVAYTTKLSSGAKRSSQDTICSDVPELHMDANAEEDDIPTDVNSKPKEEMDVITKTEGLCPSFPSEDAQQTISSQSEMTDSDKSLIPDTKECSSTMESEKTRTNIVDRAKSDMPVSPTSYRALCGVENCVRKDVSLLPDGDKLPPLLLAMGEKGKDPLVEEHLSHQLVALLLEKGGARPLTFILNANLLVNVELISYSSEKCWYFSTNGLHGLGQAEIVVLLQCLPDEKTFPNEIFKLFIDIYKNAVKGKLIRNMENVTFSENFLSNEDHGGFLFVSPTYQKLDDLMLPDNPFLCGILIHKLEIPWAKVFPIRLMLRLGAEYGVYPSPLVSFRHRKPVFGEIGHTIMNLLVDLRNYQYTLHTIDNLFVHVEMGRSCIKIPLRKYNQVMKVINSSNDHVISIGASFNTEADSHFVCVQNKQGLYHTQANSTNEHPRKVTGASFVVFNGALKTSSGFLAKSSIVEDGLMVQITPETMESLRQALRDKKDFKITCGKVDGEDLKEYVDICWVEDEEKTNKEILSQVDGKSMEGTRSEKIPHTRDFERKGKVLKCTEVYYFLKDHELPSPAHLQFAKDIATACCTALCPHLKTLKKNGMNKIGLRVSVDSDMVEYLAGSGGHLFPQKYLNELDRALIPVIHDATCCLTSSAPCLENKRWKMSGLEDTGDTLELILRQLWRGAGGRTVGGCAQTSRASMLPRDPPPFLWLTSAARCRRPSCVRLRSGLPAAFGTAAPLSAPLPRSPRLSGRARAAAMAAERSAVSAAGSPPFAPLPAGGRGGAALRAVPLGAAGAWSEAAVEHFLRAGRLAARDGAEIRWWHAANSRRQAREAARSAVHMVEADVLLRGGRGGDGDPVMAHPPETDSDITLQEWLQEMVGTDKGIKLDFKSLDAVRPSLELLQLVKPCLERPVWLNADILPGPNGISAVVDAKGFLDTVTSFFPDVTLSLGWTTGWHPEQHNDGYSWTMVKEMAQICSALSQPVTFPVRAALVRQSVSELCWLIDQSDQYSLTVWTGKQDVYSVEDLLFIRENFDKSRVYYDISEPQNSEFKKAIGIEC